MARGLALCAVLAGLVCASGCRPAAPLSVPTDPPLLAVVTWNLHAGAGDLPRFLADLSAGRLTGTPPVDYVLLLQEVSDGPATLPPSVSGRALASFYAAVRTTRRGSGNAIVSTRPLTEMRAVALPRQRQVRGAAFAAIEVGTVPLFVVSAHLENRINWWLGGLFSDTARGRQAAALLRALPPAGHGILGGDMNTLLGANEPAWRMLSERFAETPPGPYEPTFRGRLVLDHLFFDLPDGWTVTRRVVRDTYGSDHHPVIGVIRQ